MVVDGESFALQIVPSGVLYPHVTPVIGNGVVVDPRVLIAEMDMLESRGVSTANLRLSGNAHLILQYHLSVQLHHPLQNNLHSELQPLSQDSFLIIFLQYRKLYSHLHQLQLPYKLLESISLLKV